MTADSDITWLLTAAALSPGDLRLGRVVEVAERIFGESFNFEECVQGHRPLVDREAYLARLCNLGESLRPAVLTNGKDRPGGIALRIRPDDHGRQFGLSIAAVGKPALPLTVPARLGLRDFARAVEARIGYARTLKLAHLHRKQLQSGPLPAGLPHLMSSSFGRSPFRPHCIGWVNYWSRESVTLLGIEPSSLDGHPFAAAELTPEGELLLELTRDPLDPDKAEHLAILVEAHRRFPGVGRIPGGKPAESTPGRLP